MQFTDPMPVLQVRTARRGCGSCRRKRPAMPRRTQRRPLPKRLIKLKCGMASITSLNSPPAPLSDADRAKSRLLRACRERRSPIAACCWSSQNPGTSKRASLAVQEPLSTLGILAHCHMLFD